MYKIILKLGMSRLCLMSFILLCCVFTSENAFSRKHWDKQHMFLVTYNPKHHCINLFFHFYDYYFDSLKNHAFLMNLKFEYSQDGNKYTPLMSVETKEERDVGKDWTGLIMKEKKTGDEIRLFKCYLHNEGHIIPKNGIRWPDNGNDFNIRVKNTVSDYSVGNHLVPVKRGVMLVKWYLRRSCKPIQTIKIQGVWIVCGDYLRDEINEVYPVNMVKSNLNTMQNAPSVLKSEISDIVKVTGETDEISVTGAVPGENIKIYSVSGAELKSVVANDDVVNIKLPKNHIYIVKAGQTSYKVAL